MSETKKSIIKKEALELVLESSLREIISIAKATKRSHTPSAVELCSIINAKSGSCDMDCAFCSQSCLSTAEIDHYPFLSDRELRMAVRSAEASGASRIGLVTSGGRLGKREIQRLGCFIEEGRERGRAAICASFGRLDREDLVLLKSKGLQRIHHNLEASKQFYPKLSSRQSWESRLRTVQEAQTLGFEICSGGIFGCGERWEDRIDLALTLQELEIRHVPINFLIPHPGTPLSTRKQISAEEALRLIALYRILLPSASLRICGGRAQIFPDSLAELLDAGADALMIGNYLTSPGRSAGDDRRELERLGQALTPQRRG